MAKHKDLTGGGHLEGTLQEQETKKITHLDQLRQSSQKIIYEILARVQLRMEQEAMNDTHPSELF
jgi:hypothetical protein